MLDIEPGEEWSPAKYDAVLTDAGWARIGAWMNVIDCTWPVAVVRPAGA